MYLLYADESGDAGLKNSPTKHLIISGVIIEESNWNAVFNSTKLFRTLLRKKYKILLKDELHAKDLIYGRGDFFQKNLTPNERLNVYRESLDHLSTLSDIRILNICCRKHQIKQWKIDLTIFEYTWMIFVQRFHRFLEEVYRKTGNYHAGMVICDRGNEVIIQKLMRKMRVYNPIKSKFTGKFYANPVINRVIDDPIPRSSKHSYFIQFADLVAYCLLKREEPSQRLAKTNFHTFLNILDPVLLKEASTYDPLGIVFFPKK